MKVLLSIRPEYVEEIMNGSKKFEYRKRIFKKDVEAVIIYSTMPVGKIVGEFKIERIINDTPEELWNQTFTYSGISKKYFTEYFSDREEGFAIQIKDLLKYEIPITPKDVFSHFVAPQSFMYVDSNAIQDLVAI